MKSLIVIFFLFVSMALFAQESTLAPDFEMKLHDASSIRLYDYRGNVVYISFWASWCGPCISNFEKYKDIRHDLEAQGIILLNVSIDEDESKWNAAIDKLQINGLHALAKKEELYPAYQISSIPLYEIVGKDGQFLYLSDEPGRDILAQFRAWLKE